MPLDVIGAVLGPLLSALLALRQERVPRPRHRSAWFRRQRRARSRYIRTESVTAREVILR